MYESHPSFPPDTLMTFSVEKVTRTRNLEQLNKEIICRENSLERYHTNPKQGQYPPGRPCLSGRAKIARSSV
jgi:hypothetical protein